MRSKYTMKMQATVLVSAIATSLLLGNSSKVVAADEPENSTPQQVFDGMRGSFRGPNGGDWWIEVNDGTFKMGRGKIDNPSVTFITSDNDWVAMSNGKLKGTWAFMTGRLKVRGSQSVARKLDEIFP